MAQHDMSDPNESLAGLLTLARGGDEAARNQLFDRCRNYVAVVARVQIESWLQSKVDASDLIQQTLLDAHRGFDNFRGASEGEWLAWLRQIVNHNATDFVRRMGAEKRRVGREVPLGSLVESARFDPLEPVDPGDSPSAVLQQHEAEILLANAIAGLPADYQEVLQLRSLQRLPFDQVATRMNRSRPAVQMLYLRAVKQLQEAWKG